MCNTAIVEYFSSSNANNWSYQLYIFIFNKFRAFKVEEDILSALWWEVVLANPETSETLFWHIIYHILLFKLDIHNPVFVFLPMFLGGSTSLLEKKFQALCSVSCFSSCQAEWPVGVYDLLLFLYFFLRPAGENKGTRVKSRGWCRWNCLPFKFFLCPPINIIVLYWTKLFSCVIYSPKQIDLMWSRAHFNYDPRSPIKDQINKKQTSD